MSTVVKQNKRIHIMGLNPGSPHCKSTSWTPPLSTLYVKKVSFIVAPPEGKWVEEWETQHSILHWFNFRWNSQSKFCDFYLLASITLCLNVNTVCLCFNKFLLQILLPYCSYGVTSTWNEWTVDTYIIHTYWKNGISLLLFSAVVTKINGNTNKNNWQNCVTLCKCDDFRRINVYSLLYHIKFLL